MSGSTDEETDFVDGEISTPSSTLHYFANAKHKSGVHIRRSSLPDYAMDMPCITLHCSLPRARNGPDFATDSKSAIYRDMTSSGTHPHQQQEQRTTTSLFNVSPDSQGSENSMPQEAEAVRHAAFEFTKIKPRSSGSDEQNQKLHDSENLSSQSTSERRLSFGQKRCIFPVSGLDNDSDILQTQLDATPQTLADLSSSGTSKLNTISDIHPIYAESSLFAKGPCSSLIINRNRTCSTSLDASDMSHVPSHTKPRHRPNTKIVTTNSAFARIPVEAVVGQEADSTRNDVKATLEVPHCSKKNKSRPRKEAGFTENHASRPDRNAMGLTLAVPAHTLCKVCINDKASGIHYGVTSCEGCKSFFRRSLHNEAYRNFRCSREGKCMVVRMTRNRCQYCRFRKCQEVGMSRDAVRYGRLPPGKRESKQSEEAVTVQDMHLIETAELIVRVSVAYHAYCSTTSDKVAEINRKQFSLIPDDDDCTDLRVAMFQELAAIIEPQIKNLICFAKAVPGFSSFSQESQLRLLKAGFLPAWLLHIYGLFDTSERVLVMPDGQCITKEELDYTLTADMSKYLFNLSQTIASQLKLNDTEISLLMALSFLNTDHCSNSEEQEVSHAHHKLEDCLKEQLSRKHKDQPNLYDNLVTFRRELTFVATLFRSQVTKLKAHHYKFPGLFVEMFELSPF